MEDSCDISIKILMHIVLAARIKAFLKKIDWTERIDV